jgi:Mg-chelatase subunit ChlD
MKKVLSLVFFLLFALQAFAQGTFKCVFNVRDNQGKPLQDMKAEFVDGSNQQKHYAEIRGGKIEIELKSGRVWQVNIGEIKNYYKWEFDLPKIAEGKVGEYSRTFTYDYKAFRRETRPAVDRSEMDLKLVKQNLKPEEAPTNTEGIIKVQVIKSDRSPLSNFLVRLTCYALLTTYEATTNAQGNAIFKVPVGNEYQIDIDGIENFHYADLPQQTFARLNTQITYEPTVVDETEKNDTIVQKLPANVKGTSARVAVKISFAKSGGEMWQNEPIYLAAVKSKKIYKGISNSNGFCEFLLPKGDKYLINGNYEKNIDVIDLTRTRGIGYANKTVPYRPIDRYQYPEKYFPKPEELAFDDFVRFINKQFEAPKEDEGLRIYARWGNKINADSKFALLELALVSERAVPAKRRPINLSLVLDRSGSMAFENRIEKVKKALLHFIDALHEEDFVSLIVFNDDKEILLPAQKFGKDKEKFKEAIRYIEADGFTNIYSGLEQGFIEIDKNFNRKRTNRVVLLTDGHGQDEPKKSLEKAKEYQKKGVDCSVVGVGNDYNFGLLRSIANLGGGLIEFLDDKQDFKNIFAKELGAAVFPVAENVKVEVYYNKNLLFAQLLGAPLEEKKDGKVTLKLKNAYSGLDQLALLKFSLVNPSQAIEKEPVIIKTKYVDLQKEKTVEIETKAFLQWSPDTGKLEFLLDAETKYYYSVALLNQTLQVMSEAFAKGDRQGARNALTKAISEVREIFPNVDKKDIQELLAKLEYYEEILKNLR